MNLFKTPENYREMLDIIGWYTFGFLVIYTLIIRANVPEIDLFLIRYEPSFNIAVLGINFKFFTVFIPIFLAVLSRSIKLHDKLSTLIKIREIFDTNHILKIFISELNIPSINDAKLIEKRSELMRKVFYKYTSSTEGMEMIDRHLIVMALDQWLWFWIVIEANFYLIFLTCLFLFCNREYGITFLVTNILSIAYLYFSYKESIKNARNQISEILNNEQYKNEIKGVFCEVHN